MRRFLAALLAIAPVACAPARPFVVPMRYTSAEAAHSPTEDAAFRTTPPSLPAETTAKRVEIQSFTLDNGLTVLFVERHSFPLVVTRLIIDLDANDDVGGRRALLTGSVFLSPPGGVIQTRAGCGRTACSLVSRGSSDQLDEVLARLASLLQPPALPRAEYERRLATATRALEGTEYTPALAIKRMARALLFGSHHAYGESSPKSHVITLAEVMSFRDRAFVPSAATLVLVGDVSLEAARASVAKNLGSWIGAKLDGRQPASSATLPPPPAPASPRIAAFYDGRLTQLHGMVAARGPAPGDADATAFTLAGDLLGGTHSSTAFRHVREELAAAYAVGASVELYPGASILGVGGSFERGKAFEGLSALIGAISTLREVEPTIVQVALAKGVSLGRWRRSMATAEGIATLLADSVALRLPPESSQDLPARVRVVTPTDMSAVARRYLDPGALRVVLVGDPAYLTNADSLGFGVPTRTNGYGEPLH